MTIYIDSECKCHVTNPDGTYTAVEAPPELEGACAAYIEGYRLVPEGETWVREDGEVFTGLMIAPWKNYAELEKAQLEYELEQLKAEKADMQSALELLGVTDNE